MRNDVLRWTVVKTSSLRARDPKPYHCSPCKQGVRDTKGEEVTQDKDSHRGTSWENEADAGVRPQTKRWQGLKATRGKEAPKQLCCPHMSFGRSSDLQNHQRANYFSSDSYGNFVVAAPVQMSSWGPTPL